eukprot:g40874.t1
MLRKPVAWSVFSLPDVEETTSGVLDAVNQVGDGDREIQERVGRVRNGSVEFENGLEGISEVDELLKLLVGAQGSTDMVVNMTEKE